MKDNYMKYYILSYFRKERTTSVSQILHVFHAKRTPSMFYMIEINHWHHGFALSSKIERKDLEKVIQALYQKDYLKEEGKGFLLTDVGEEKCQIYFKTHYYPKHIQSFTNANVRQPFWNRLQLFAQVFSELSYQNVKYTPVVKHPHHLENVRQLFQQFPSKKDKLLKQWLKEQTFLFDRLESDQANVLASQLTGHGVIGETASQIANALEMEARELYFYQEDAVEALIQQVKKYKNVLNLTSIILKQVHQETNMGLSLSTKRTYEMLKAGHTIEQIARQRSIKENTVREHILEMAFVFMNFPYHKFVPERIYQTLHHRFNEDEHYDYKQAMAEHDALEFMHFRLVELERMRME